jgi:hypothetical protein
VIAPIWERVEAGSGELLWGDGRGHRCYRHDFLSAGGY